MKLATRISRISVSKTMAVMEAAIKLRDQGIDVVDFGPGEPDFPTPENVKQAGISAIQDNFTKYTAIGGIKELKKAIVEKHATLASASSTSEASMRCSISSPPSLRKATRLSFLPHTGLRLETSLAS
jgi:aspartate aminotransferase